MSDLEQVKGFIAKGDREDAIALLASTLLKNSDHLEAWLLLGDMIEEPSRKKACYKQVLRLAPRNFHALTRLQELQETQPDGQQLTHSDELVDEDKRPTIKARKPVNYIPNQNLYKSANNTTGGGEIIGYLMVGLAGFLVITYVIASPNNSSSNSDSLYIGLTLLSLIAGILILSVSSKHRG